ncbi:MAG: efflux RND transporter permease subunit [Gammaproteobacteria bacterium]|nr:efflux RND transporter permease subunit [Gammaproteobacteria bacterium]
MKHFTDIFIQRPVLAITVSLLVLVLGLQAISILPVRQFPETQNAVITVSTVYYGADANTIAGFITQPLEGAIAQAGGIDYLSSISVSSASTISATLRLNYDSNRALTDISSKVNAVLNQLPRQAQQPVITVQVGETVDSMYMGFFGKDLPNNNLTDYLLRVVKPQLDGIEGVQRAEILGGRQFALRAWLDPKRMAAYAVTASDVNAALASNNYLAALGTTKGQMVSVDLTAATDLHSVEEFKQLVIKRHGDAVVRLHDVADVVLGAEDYNLTTAFGGRKAVFIGIKVAPDANILEVIGRVKQVFPDIQAQMPSGITGKIVYDGTRFIDSSIREVVKTLAEALLIVSLVVFLFLGSARAVIIPLVAIPLSMIGAFAVMLALGYTINLLTLLALVLAIGLVVDDAIIVVENVDRHMKEGKSPLAASLIGARELGGPIIAMTIVLIAVYVPIGFQGGLTGALFSEFAFTLAGAVTVSGIIALTLSPMMTAKFFRADQDSTALVRFVDRAFDKVRHGYQRRLHGAMNTWKVQIVMGFLLLLGVVFLFATSASELAPEEDQGIVAGQIIGAPNATNAQMQTYADQAFAIARQLPEYDQMFQITGIPTVNSGIGGVLFKPWEERSRNAKELQQELQQKWNGIAGAQVAAFQFPPLPGSGGLPLQFVVKSTESFTSLNAVVQQVVDQAQATGMFFFINSDLKIDKPQSTVRVDRDMVSALGLTQQDVGEALSSALSGGYVNYFSIDGRSYRVIPQVKQAERLNPDQVLDYYIRAADGSVLPASTVASISHEVVPESINRFQQLNSATIQGVYAPGVTQQQVLTFLGDTLHAVAPSGFSIDYAGQSRQFMQESGGFVFTMLFAIVIVFLALSIQFNSFRDPLIILVSVPMALLGALLFINLGLATINIYTQVGLVTLMGLISKHGILIVQFANDLQRAGVAKRAAIEEAAAVRLRPILMTTAAMVLGVIPLVLASGAGAAGRYSMGLVIFTGLSIGTVFTLFVVPAMYMLLATDHLAAEGSVTSSENQMMLDDVPGE